MKVRIAVVLSAALALALSAAAQAALPKTSNKLIVPNKSIGGVALGDKASAVTKAWGHNSTCQLECSYEGRKPNTGSPSLGSVLLESKSSGAPAKVWSVAIAAGYKTVGSKSVPNFNTPLTQFKTAKGIGLGSTVGQLKHAYHAAKKESSLAYTINGPKQIATTFSIASHKITSIAVRAHPGG